MVTNDERREVAQKLREMLWPLLEFSCTLASLTSVALGKMDHAILLAVLAVSAKLELMRGNR